MGSFAVGGPPIATNGRNAMAGFLNYIFAPPRDDPMYSGPSAPSTNGGPADGWGVMGTKFESEAFRTE